MLYLIKSYLYGGKSILKIGYTDDIDKRMYQYFSSNPGFEKISTREGNKILEDMIQIYLTYLGYQVKIGGRLNEWFMNSPKATDIEDWFELRNATVLSDAGKQLRGFEILALKKK